MNTGFQCLRHGYPWLSPRQTGGYKAERLGGAHELAELNAIRGPSRGRIARPPEGFVTIRGRTGGSTSRAGRAFDREQILHHRREIGGAFHAAERVVHAPV